MSTNGKQFITLQITIIAVFGAIIIYVFQLMDTKVERSINQTVKLMERIGVIEARIHSIEKRQDILYENIIRIEKEKKNDSKSDK